jgi:dienelactone hydrolase
VADIGAALAHLRGRPELDPARVGLLGHSEGGYLAPLAAQRLPGTVAFAVLLAGPAVPGEDVLVELILSAPALAALRVPVLALYGGKDLQVPAAQSGPVLRARLAGDPDATVRTLDGLNQLMQPAATGLPQEYATIPTTLDPQVLELVTSWIGTHA